jgi:hypothetical protein
MGKKSLYIKTTDNGSENEKTALGSAGQNGALMPSGRPPGHERPSGNHNGAQNHDSIPWIGFDFDSDDDHQVDEDDNKNAEEDG